MSKLRILAVTLFSIGLAFSSFTSLKIASAADISALDSIEAKNTGGTSAKEAGDSLVVSFTESSNKFAITSSNIDDLLVLSNGHSFLDGAGAIGSATWNTDGKKLTITLSAGTSLPTVTVGDQVTLDGTSIKDAAGQNRFTGMETIHGSFGDTTSGGGSGDDDEDEDSNDDDCEIRAANSSDNGHGDGDDDEDEDSNDDEDNDEDEDINDDCGDNGKLECNNALNNGKLYKIGTEPTVYLAVRHCILKPFRGAAVFHARGHKFQDIIVLSALPAGVTISGEPALPVEGTLIKGSDKTVWFIGHNGKRRGFVSADVFGKLGFKFDQVQEISDSDLGELPKEDSNVSDDSHHPDGSLIKCGNSAAVFVVIGNDRLPFASAEAFQGRGHSFEHILNVDCGRFAYRDGAAVTE